MAKLLIFLPPANEGNAFSHVYLSVWSQGVQHDNYQSCIGLHHTVTPARNDPIHLLYSDPHC